MNPRIVTIKLTDAQRAKLRTLTGETHGEIRFEAPGSKGPLAPRSSVAKRLAGRKAMAKKLSGKKAMAKKAPMARKLAGKKAMAKKTPMARKLAGKKAMAKKLAGRKSLARKSPMSAPGRLSANHNQIALFA